MHFAVPVGSPVEVPDADGTTSFASIAPNPRFAVPFTICPSMRTKIPDRHFHFNIDRTPFAPHFFSPLLPNSFYFQDMVTTNHFSSSGIVWIRMEIIGARVHLSVKLSIQALFLPKALVEIITVSGTKPAPTEIARR